MHDLFDEHQIIADIIFIFNLFPESKLKILID